MRFSRSRTPRPNLSVPQLFETTVRSLTPVLRIASMVVAGMPLRPKPPARILSPSLRPEAVTAAAAESYTLFTRLLEAPKANPRDCVWVAVEAAEAAARTDRLNISDYIKRIASGEDISEGGAGFDAMDLKTGAISDQVRVRATRARPHRFHNEGFT